MASIPASAHASSFSLPRAPILHTEAPYYFRREDRSLSEEQFSQFCADRLEEMILAEGPETVAAFIGENVRGVTWVKISEVASGDWGIAGQPLTTEAANAVLGSGRKAA